MMFLLALAVAPGLAIAFYIYWRDRYDREPFINVLVAFLLGVVSTVPAIIVQLWLRQKLDDNLAGGSLVYYAWFAFGVVAFSEESSKFIMLRLYAYPRKAFNEPFDGIVYSVMIGMGFATAENIGYVYQHGISTAVIRMFLSVPAHATFAVLMGYQAGLAKFNPESSFSHLLKGLLLAIFFHGAFDFFLFLQQSHEVTQYVSGSLLTLGALVSFWIALRLSFRSIRLHQQLSAKNFGNNDSIHL